LLEGLSQKKRVKEDPKLKRKGGVSIRKLGVGPQMKRRLGNWLREKAFGEREGKKDLATKSLWRKKLGVKTPTKGGKGWGGGGQSFSKKGSVSKRTRSTPPQLQKGGEKDAGGKNRQSCRK